MKIISTLYDIKNLNNILEFADGIMIGNQDIGTRLTKSFSYEAITDIIQQTKALEKEVFIQGNQIFNDEQLSHFELQIKRLPMHQIDGIIVADLGAYQVLKQLGYQDKVIYNPETLLTNHYDFNFLADFDILGVYVAKEITLHDLLEIAEKKKYKLFMVGHGHLNMFYSKRQLIHNFMAYQNEDNQFHERQDLKIIEENRKDEAYPILEDQAGTHVFRSQVFQTLSHLDKLSDMVDYLAIDTIFKDDQYATLVLPMYTHLGYQEDRVHRIQKSYKEIWDDGFFYKKTIYKSKG